MKLNFAIAATVLAVNVNAIKIGANLHSDHQMMGAPIMLAPAPSVLEEAAVLEPQQQPEVMMTGVGGQGSLPPTMGVISAGPAAIQSQPNPDAIKAALAAQAEHNAFHTNSISSGCGGAKGDFGQSLTTESAWAAFQGAWQCHQNASNARMTTRNVAVQAWFKSVDAAAASSAALGKASAALAARGITRSSTLNASTAAAKEYARLQGIANMAIAAEKAAAGAQTSANAAADTGLAGAVKTAATVKGDNSKAVAKATAAKVSAIKVSTDAAAAAKKALGVSTDAQVAYNKASSAYQVAKSDNTAKQTTATKSKAASLAAHANYRSAAIANAANGYYH